MYLPSYRRKYTGKTYGQLRINSRVGISNNLKHELIFPIVNNEPVRKQTPSE